MSFGLKNARATYQRFVNMIFTPLIGKSIEVYVDDILVKCKHVSDHVVDLKYCFNVLRQYRMKLNQGKYVLGFMVNHRGIKVNPTKVQVVVDLQLPRIIKEIERLTEIIVALSRFISRSTDKCHPFFQTLKGIGKINWVDKFKEAF